MGNWLSETGVSGAFSGLKILLGAISLNHWQQERITGIFWIPAAFREQKRGRGAGHGGEQERRQSKRVEEKQAKSFQEEAVWSASSDFIVEFIKMKVLTFPFNLTARRCLLRGFQGNDGKSG